MELVSMRRIFSIEREYPNLIAIVLLIAVSLVVSADVGAAQKKGDAKQSLQTVTPRYDFCGTQSWQRRTMVCRRGQNGKGYTVCENYLKYLNQSLPKLTNCEIPVPPKFKKPDWEELDIKSNLQLAYEAETMSQYKKPDFETWKTKMLEKIASGKIVPSMRKARITPTSRGEVTILGYTRDSTGCEKAERGIPDDESQMNNEWRDPTSGYIHYILTAQGGLLRIPGNFGGVSGLHHELLLYAGKPYFVSTFGIPGNLPPRGIFAVDQYPYEKSPEELWTDQLCQFETVNNPSSKGR